MVFVFYDFLGNALCVVVMAALLIAAIGVVYLVVAVQLLLEGKTGLGIAFLGYALGNVGLTLAART